MHGAGNGACWGSLSHMAHGWDTFIVRLDEQTSGSIVLDLDASPDASPGLDTLLTARIELSHPGDHGMSTADEESDLAMVEDAFEEYVSTQLTGRYVGRITFRGRRVFYAYVPGSADVERGAIGFSGYEAILKTDEDPDWERFFRDLYPADDEFQCIMNRRVVAKLEESGDDLAVAREVEHWAYFDDAADAEAFAAAGVEAGYALRQRAEVEGRHKVQLHRVEPVDLDSIDASTLTLFELARDHHGHYDGWETSVVED